MFNLDRLHKEKFLGCGCSTFGGSVSKKAANRTLEFCFDNGIEYYDVARSYGFGQAESIVGSFIKDKRDKVIIASKFGIEAPKTFPLRGLVTTLARFAKNYMPSTKKLLNNVSGQVLKKQAFSPQMIMASLDKSLKELNTSYLDLFIYHEASFEHMLNDDIKDLLTKEQEKGKIRAWGFNVSNKDDQLNILSKDLSSDVLQIPFSLNNIFNDLTHRTHQINIIYSIMRLFQSFDENQKNRLVKARNDEKRLGDIRNELEMLLYLAYHDLDAGVLLMSTTDMVHVERNIKIAKMEKLDNKTFDRIKELLLN